MDPAITATMMMMSVVLSACDEPLDVEEDVWGDDCKSVTFIAVVRNLSKLMEPSLVK